MTDLPTRGSTQDVLSAPRRRPRRTITARMSYLESLRVAWSLYLPLAIIVFVLLFPFYWMG